MLTPIALFAIGAISDQVPLHGSLAIAGSDLDDLGYLDVTASGYGADDTGQNDSTAAIQAAVDAAYSNNMAVYFPPGTYMISGTINCWQNLFLSGTSYGSQLRHAHVLVGSTSGDGVTIKLADNAAGFGNEAVKKNLFQFWCADRKHPNTQNVAYFDSSRHYNAEMRDLKIDLGSGNTGAVAIWMQGAQGCNIQNVDIDINSGFAGIAGLVGAGSGHAKLTLRNGKYGVWCSRGYMGEETTSQPMPYLAGCRFFNQSESALYLDSLNGTLTLIGFRIDMTNAPNKKAVVLYDSWGESANSLNLVDGTIEMAGSGSVAVANDGKKSVNMENVYIKAAMIVDCVDNDGDQAGSATAWRKVNSFSYIGQDEIVDNPQSNPALAFQDGVLVTNKTRVNILQTAPAAADYDKLVAMHLWKCDFPTYEDGDCYIADELDRTGTTDVTSALQSIINGHDKVFLPKGIYKISDTITLAQNKMLFGIAKNLSIIKPDPALADPGAENPLYMIETADSADSQTILAFLEFQQNPAQTNIASVHWRAGKRSVLRNVQQWYSSNNVKYRNYADFWFSGSGGGKIYNFHHTYSIKPASVGYRPAALRFYGISVPTYVYGLNSEGAWSDGQLRIDSSKDVYIVSYKDENTWETDFLNPQNPKFIKALVNSSTNIGFYGMEHLIHGPQTGAYSTVICNADDIRIHNLVRILGSVAATNASLCHMLYQDADGNDTPELTLCATNALSRYDLGTFTRDISGSVICTLLNDTFDYDQDYWCETSSGFSISNQTGLLEEGAQDYLGSCNYDDVKVSYDFADVTEDSSSKSSWQVLRSRIRAQSDRLGDCYEVRLHRDGILHIMATTMSGSQVSVVSSDTGLSDIQGAVHHMEILIKTAPNGDIKIEAAFDADGTDHDRTVSWTHAVTDTLYKRCHRGTIGFYSASSENTVDNFSVEDGALFAKTGSMGGLSLLFLLTAL